MRAALSARMRGRDLWLYLLACPGTGVLHWGKGAQTGTEAPRSEQ